MWPKTGKVKNLPWRWKHCVFVKFQWRSTNLHGRMTQRTRVYCRGAQFCNSTQKWLLVLHRNSWCFLRLVWLPLFKKKKRGTECAELCSLQIIRNTNRKQIDCSAVSCVRQLNVLQCTSFADPQTLVDLNITLVGHWDRNMCARFGGCKKFGAVPGSIWKLRS